MFITWYILYHYLYTLFIPFTFFSLYPFHFYIIWLFLHYFGIFGYNHYIPNLGYISVLCQLLKALHFYIIFKFMFTGLFQLIQKVALGSDLKWSPIYVAQRVSVRKTISRSFFLFSEFWFLFK